MLKKLQTPALLVAAVAMMAAFTVLSNDSDKTQPTVQPRGEYAFNAAGELIRPEGYRQWVYVGTPITPNDLNPPEAPFPDFHNVYIHPDDFSHYQRTGNFQDGTILVKELVSVGSKQAVSGKGYFMGEFTGLEATIKDASRFPDEPGNWAYFSFGHSYPLAETAKAFPAAACNSCHAAAAADDFVFTQYYPILRAAKGGEGAMAQRSAMRSAQPASAMSIDEMQSARDGALGMVPTTKEALFPYLQAGGYKDFVHEAEAHPSLGPHDNVKTYLNPILARSVEVGNSVHPVNAAAVKELYKEGRMYGWAAIVKTQADSDNGQGWYWYEVLSTTDRTNLAADGNGDPFCAGCHSAGRDFIRINPSNFDFR